MKFPVQRYVTLLAKYLKPQWRQTVLLCVLLLLNIGLQLLNPQLLKDFIDTATKGGSTSSLVLLACLFILVVLANQSAAIAVSYLSTNVAWRATNRLRTDMVAHCLTLDMAFHKAHTSGEFIERIDGDVDLLSNFFSQFVIHLLSGGLLLIGILVLFFRIDWFVGVVMTLFSIVAMIILIALRRLTLPYFVAQRQMSATFFGFLGERLAGTEDIRANGATAYTMLRFYRLLREWWFISLRSNVYGTFMVASTLALFIFCTALGLALGALLLDRGTATIGTVYLIMAYTMLISQPIQQIQDQLQDLQQADACIQRVEEFLHMGTTLQDGSGKPLPAGPLAVEFQNVSFGYSESDTVLHNLSFSLAPERTLGVVGRTGSGKTTLARLLFRLYDPQQGDICVGGVPVNQAFLHDLRRRIGMVTQDIQLFHATVRDNLTFFDRSIDDKSILQAIDDVGLLYWYQALSDGLDTELGSDGEGLSAGEAQLLAFARVFLANPSIVILDEASSRLDSATEALIERAVSKLLEGRTAIVIAHRLATLQRVDDILVLQDGHVLEHGSRIALSTDLNSHFARLLQTGLEEVKV